jgi:hypothetical protein
VTLDKKDLMTNMTRCAFYPLMLLACCAPSSMGAQGMAHGDRIGPSVKIRVQAFDTWFRELPSYAVVTITNSTERPVEMPVWTPWGHMPIAIVVAGTNGQEVVSLIPAGLFFRTPSGIGGPGPAPAHPTPRRLLAPGVTRVAYKNERREKANSYQS